MWPKLFFQFLKPLQWAAIQFLLIIYWINPMLWWPFLELILKCLYMKPSNYLNEDIWWKKISKFFKSNFFFDRSNKWLKIMFCLMSAVDLVGVTIWWLHVKALGMRMWKLVLGLSLAQILPEKINKMIRMLCPGRFSLVESVFEIGLLALQLFQIKFFMIINAKNLKKSLKIKVYYSAKISLA